MLNVKRRRALQFLRTELGRPGRLIVFVASKRPDEAGFHREDFDRPEGIRRITLVAASDCLCGATHPLRDGPAARRVTTAGVDPEHHHQERSKEPRPRQREHLTFLTLNIFTIEHLTFNIDSRQFSFTCPRN